MDPSSYWLPNDAVTVVVQMFKDIALFLLVFGLFLFGFAFAFFILQVRTVVRCSWV